MKNYIRESIRIPVVEKCDVLVCGGGPAGISAAISAARAGAQTRLIEANGCLGGIWTAGLMSLILDHENKSGLLKEIMINLKKRGAIGRNYDIETLKLLLEEMCMDAGVNIRLHTRICSARVNKTRRVEAAVTEAKSGREAWKAKMFIDCTGDGDFAFHSGCGYDLGHEKTGETQPMSMIALVAGVKIEDMAPFCTTKGQMLLKTLNKAGISPSYGKPSFFHIYDDLYALMSNHEYNVSANNAEDITSATINGRSEINRHINALKSLGGIWKNLKLLATSEHIGIREGRRIHGLYKVTADDLKCGRKHSDSACSVSFGVDIHSTDPEKSKGTLNGGIKVSQPYDIPVRALIAKDVSGLLMAGRCISGDFYSHASYRVTGNAVAMGEAAGSLAARAALAHLMPHDL